MSDPKIELDDKTLARISAGLAGATGKTPPRYCSHTATVRGPVTTTSTGMYEHAPASQMPCGHDAEYVITSNTGYELGACGVHVGDMQRDYQVTNATPIPGRGRKNEFYSPADDTPSKFAGLILGQPLGNDEEV